jgi:hypothetical protein
MCSADGAAPGRRAAAGQSEQLVSRTLVAAGLNRPAVLPWDGDVRAVPDVLTGAEVKPKRLGSVGQLGAALDDRAGGGGVRVPGAASAHGRGR